jgi:peptidoglycan/xylan/chitin deacetylase (PgdA/CDA1 family)
VYTEVLPILRRCKLPATVLVCPDLIKNPDRDLLRRRHGLSESSTLSVLTPEQLRELAASKFVTVGNHTATHPNLTELSVEEVHAEVVGSKAQLERLTGTSVTRFSYPYGKVTDEIARVVEGTYEISFTSQPDFLPTDPVPHRLPRLDACLPVEVLSFETTDMAHALRRVARRLNLE